MKKDRILGIIPARSGSKRLKNKNLLNLHDKPLIAWTIEAALQAEIFDTVMVNTDSVQIQNAVAEYDVATPFLRSSDLSSDTATTMDVIMNTISYYESEHVFFDIVFLLQPTSPLRIASDINAALDLFYEKEKTPIVSVTEINHPIQWCNTLEDSLSMKNFILKEHIGKRSQDLEKYYRINGAIYLSSVDDLKDQKSFLTTNAHAFIMPSERSIDIDTMLDFKIAEVFLSDKLI